MYSGVQKFWREEFSFLLSGLSASASTQIKKKKKSGPDPCSHILIAATYEQLKSCNACSFPSPFLSHITTTHFFWSARTAITDSCSLPAFRALFSVLDEIWSESRHGACFHPLLSDMLESSEQSPAIWLKGGRGGWHLGHHEQAPWQNHTARAPVPSTPELLAR